VFLLRSGGFCSASKPNSLRGFEAKQRMKW
jgi:hypothetical protein